MTVLRHVQDLIAREAPKALCDDCIARNLKLSIRPHANHKTRELAATAAFDRRRDGCGACGNQKLVIRSV